jgi:hypothetical protein
MEIKMNETRTAIVNVLKDAAAPMTLKEISAAVGFEVKSGTTNAMLKAGIIIKAGVREIVCELCGHKHKVAEYVIGTIPAAATDIPNKK